MNLPARTTKVGHLEPQFVVSQSMVKIKKKIMRPGLARNPISPRIGKVRIFYSDSLRSLVYLCREWSNFACRGRSGESAGQSLFGAFHRGGGARVAV